MEVDFLIVGHGIAGICIAEQLEQKNASFIVLDKDQSLTSSKIAAGLYNPITGRKMKRTWMAEALFPYLSTFYRSLENKLSTHFYHPKNIYRPFLSVEDQNEWIGNNLDNDPFIESIYTKSTYNDFVYDPFGGLLLKHAGYVDLGDLIEAHKTLLLQKEIYREEIFDHENLLLEEGKVVYEDIKAKSIIFCDGPLSNNPYFSWVPTAPVKGEILHIETTQPLPENIIFNRGVFILKPKKKNYYRVGSTYEWKKLDWQPTEKAREQLIQKLDDLLKADYKIIEQQAGIRPASKDRRPLIGQHPEYSNVYLFNGLGTKGVSLAPYFSKQFIDSLFSDMKINEEVNISRYYSLY